MLSLILRAYAKHHQIFSVVWTAYTCKTYDYLITDFDDCKDCFDLSGRENTRWTVKKDAGVDVSIDEVIPVTRDGAIRIGGTWLHLL